MLIRALSLSLALLAVPAMAAAPVVSNIRASQRPGTKLVDISSPSASVLSAGSVMALSTSTGPAMEEKG